MPSPKITEDLLRKRIAAWQKQVELAKAAYNLADAMEAQLLASFGKAKIILADGSVAHVRDNFAGKNVAFRAAKIKRLEIEICKPKKEK